jgi:hypothetical protein
MKVPVLPTLTVKRQWQALHDDACYVCVPSRRGGPSEQAGSCRHCMTVPGLSVHCTVQSVLANQPGTDRHCMTVPGLSVHCTVQSVLANQPGTDRHCMTVPGLSVHCTVHSVLANQPGTA